MADTQRFPVGVVKVDEEGVATAMINTPDKPGRYKAVFRLQKLGPNKSANGQRFGGQLFIDINVVATQEELEEALIRQSREQAEKDRIRRLRADMQEKKMKARQEIQAARKTFRATKHARKAEIDQAKAAFDAERRISNAKRQQMNVSGRIAMLDAKMQKASLKPKKQANLERRRQALQDKLAQIEAEIAAAQSGDDADLDGLYSDDGSDPTAAVANPDDSKDGGCDDAPAAADADDLSDVFEPTAGDLVVDGPRFDDAPGAAEEEEDAPLIPQPASPAKQGSPAQSHDSFELVDAPMVDAQEPALPTAPPADFYPHQNQLDALMGMGFGDEDMARFALDANGGDLDQSVAMILQQMGHSA